MYEPTEKLDVPASFPFPFTPYKIQEDLMSALFQVIENKKIGIFESPTGTGKSLSLTCGALTWLRNHEALLSQELTARIAQLHADTFKGGQSTDAGDWIAEEYEKIQKKGSLNHLKALAAKIEQHENKIKEIRRKYAEGRKERPFHKAGAFKKDTVELLEASTDSVEDDEFDLKETEDDDGEECGLDQTDENKFRDIKIFFSSRTHSQLSQVVNEIKNTAFRSDIRVVTLASRQITCIHPEVSTIKSSALLNDRCLELQKTTSKVTATADDQRATKRQKTTSQRCPYLQPANVERLKVQSLCEIMDIEELVGVAKQQVKGCAYYSSRQAVADAQVVMVPYQILLHKKTRQQFGIDLRDAVVIVDEAHNLLDTISSIHSAELPLDLLRAGKEQLQRYKKKYLSRFAARNVLKLNQLIFVVTRLLKMCSEAVDGSRMLFSHELITEGEFFNIDLDGICRFCEATCLADKVHGFAQKFGGAEEEKKGVENNLKTMLKQMENRASPKESPQKPKVTPQAEVAKPVPNALRPLITFLKCLTENYDDGRILITKATAIKYLLLNPGARFDDILTECRSLILAGGTMKPTDEITQQLFAGCSERVEIHSFDHIVGGDAILPIVVAKGPGGQPLVFNYANRGDAAALHELGATLVNVCRVVPAGVVCFFSSYDYLDAVWRAMEASGALRQLEANKVVFRETRSSAAADSILIEYAKRIKDLKNSSSGQTGAILFSVVGGKLSEGLNFSDDLGRCVVVVGLPYPNKTSPELNEKIGYLNRQLGAGAGNEYYENLCMKAVNQCIGRAVRHINDYASVLLIDGRYNQSNIRQKLPKWIAQHLRQPDNYGQVQGMLARFFKEKAKKV